MRAEPRPTGFHRLVVLTPAQTNPVLGVLLIAAVLTGVASWALPDRGSGWATTLHVISGVSVVLVLPSKLAGPVRTGLRRRSAMRWVSVVFGVAVVATLGLGFAHATGAAYGVGLWSPLWTHQLLGFVSVALGLVHVASRPIRSRRPDLGRRAALRYATIGASAAVLTTAQRPIPGLLGAPRRRGTGSYEVASYDPVALPVVYWINDRRPADTEPGTWRLRIQGNPVSIEDLWAMSSPLDAVLDCTGGWWSAQRWDAVPLADLVRAPSGRSMRVVSATGYRRWHAIDDLGAVHLAVGYGGHPLRPGHGGPVRLVVPGRRGPEWIKWVTEVTDDRRPAWAAFPLPLS